jgi:hypothetical protein
VSDRDPERFVTSLGPEAVRGAEAWVLDLTELPLLHGLSVLSRALGDLVVEQARSDRVEIAVERTVNVRENPELLQVLGVRAVRISAEHGLVAAIAGHAEGFQSCLRAIFGTLQRQAYREALFAASTGASRALVFDLRPAGPGTQPLRFLLERLRWAPRPPEWYLRITIEDPCGRHLDLGSIPHAVVDPRDLEERTFIAGSTRIAQAWRDGIRREADRGRRTFVEVRKPYVHVFAQFAKAGLGEIEQIALSWGDAFVPRILEGDPAELDVLLKRTLLALEDRHIRQILGARGVLRIVCGDVSVYVDRSQLGRVLNISLGQARARADIGSFLRRMPVLSRIVESQASRPLRDIRVFLVHHITAEVLGLVAALRELGCRDLTTLFVAYAGEAPASYLGPLLDLPAGEARFLALTNVPDAHSVEGHYRLSSQYSVLDTAAAIGDALAGRRWRYLEAMQVAGLVEFGRLLRRAEEAGERCLLVEDGGYLAPLLNRAALEGLTMREMLGAYDPECDDDRPVASVLERLLIGSVEHTRNGHNRLGAVEAQHGTLLRPAFSIAISRLKRVDEAQEVAVSVLNALENVLHAGGRVLSRRRCVVIGSRGAIGRSLVRALSARVRDPLQVAGIDCVVPGGDEADWTLCERDAWGRLPAAVRRQVDLVIGVTGCSVLQPDDVIEWLMEGESRDLVLVSGSTKTEEFSGVSAWLDGLLRDPAPRVAGQPVRLALEPLIDPVSARTFGHRCRIAIGDAPAVERQILLVADLTPANFMFYGVPTEMIDEVLGQLLECSLGLVRRATAGLLPPRLFAVDRDIAPDGTPLVRRAAAVHLTVATQISGLLDPSSTAT